MMRKRMTMRTRRRWMPLMRSIWTPRSPLRTAKGHLSPAALRTCTPSSPLPASATMQCAFPNPKRTLSPALPWCSKPLLPVALSTERTMTTNLLPPPSRSTTLFSLNSPTRTRRPTHLST
ncbi:hypothetical protein BC829DRAFT_390435 [Chytridium lagenaria]|nr:hypothetical protein BC829DRAFT_390435 [Chytridium lagenaria]